MEQNIQQAYVYKDFFAYELDFPALAPGNSQTGSINVQADSDFIWSKGCYFADIAAAAQADATRIIPLCSVLITDSGAGRQLMNGSVPVPSMFGTGELPFILPMQRIFRSQSVITVQVTNFDAAVTYNLRLSFIGLKGFWA